MKKVKFQVYLTHYATAYVGLFALKYGFFAQAGGIQWGKAMAHLIEHHVLGLSKKPLAEKEAWVREFQDAHKQVTGEPWSLIK